MAFSVMKLALRDELEWKVTKRGCLHSPGKGSPYAGRVLLPERFEDGEKKRQQDSRRDGEGEGGRERGMEGTSTRRE